MTNIQKLGVYTVLTVTLIGFTVSNAYANTITNQNIANQEKVVVQKMIETMEEQIKLIQMIYIKRLEQRVAELEMNLVGN